MTCQWQHLESVTYTKPLWMCLDQVLLHEFANICHRPGYDFLRLLFCNLLGNTEHLNHQILYSIHILQSVVRDAGNKVYLLQTFEPSHVLSLSSLNNDITVFHQGPANLGLSRHIQLHKLQLHELIHSQS